MRAKYDRDSWIYDFSLVLTQRAIRSFRPYHALPVGSHSSRPSL
jgi:hypothetical protein